ncbi:NRDE family protein [Domibacillus tundrae]|uniref:NRDE family protein n=1 Tax=Domibacillus tundrae TaxID=1587527 RepID=UPI0006182A92|nr:NRDE family protein [Domibacillus tundrae]
MCLIAIAFRQHTDKPLIVAANRDEFYHRPTEVSHWWDNVPILAGRDLEKGGTWMGVSKNGRFCALTNYRDPNEQSAGKESRGHIVRAFLESHLTAEVFLNELDREKDRYPGFNLVAGTKDELYAYGSRSGEKPFLLPPGIHVVSNAFINTPWPKTVRAKEKMAAALNSREELFDMLCDYTAADDSELPDTGVSIEWERLLSPIFIKSETYGTRSSTILEISKNHSAVWTERTVESTKPVKEQTFSFKIN